MHLHPHRSLRATFVPSFPMSFGSSNHGGRPGRGARGGPAHGNRGPWQSTSGDGGSGAGGGRQRRGGGGGDRGRARGRGGGSRGRSGGGSVSQFFKRTMVEDPWVPLMKRGAAAGGQQHAPNSAVQRPESMQVHAPPRGFAGHVQQVLPPPGVVRQPLTPQSQLAAQLGICSQGGRATLGANTDNSAEMILASAPIGADGNPLGRIFVGGLPQVSAQ